MGTAGTVLKRKFFGDVDTSTAINRAEAEAWSSSARPASGDVTEAIYNLQLKAYDESLESYRNSQRQFDVVIVFGGAAIAWLSKFISELESQAASLSLAGLSALGFGLAIASAFLGRRSMERPTLIDIVSVLKNAQGRDLAGVQDWIARTLHVNRRVFEQIITVAAKRLAIASWLIVVSVLLAAMAVASQAIL